MADERVAALEAEVASLREQNVRLRTVIRAAVAVLTPAGQDAPSPAGELAVEPHEGLPPVG
ncbi:MAG: hypothetical protein ACRD0K_12600 [Egibacteraceae bacterium]